jgi:cytochrome c peroxidase
MPRAFPTFSPLLGLVLLAAAGACVGESDEALDEEAGESEAIATDQQAARSRPKETGKVLFERETFGGNGRTCSTCHTKRTGTINPEQIQELAEEDPDHPIFRSIDSDDGAGESYSRLMSNATVRIKMPLPPNIRLKHDPNATHVVLNRGTPTVRDTPALDPVLMSDGRAPNLQLQALDAVHSHFENGVEPTSAQLDAIAAFQRTLFSSDELEDFAAGGPPPELPDGNSPSERRGRAFFEPEGACGSCHSGPMLNTTTEFEPIGTGPGARFSTVFAGFPAAIGGTQPDDAPNPILLWNMDCAPGSFLCTFPEQFGAWLEDDGTVTMPMPDPGVTLSTGNVDAFLFFKIPTLWGIEDTAPYFHDNSAADLEELMEHYDLFLAAFTGRGLTSQEQRDIIAYMKLL